MGALKTIRDSAVLPAGALLFGLASFVAMFVYTTPRMYGVVTPINYIGYWHIALAWISGVALLVTFGASGWYLHTRTRRFNLLAHSAGESGFVLLTGTLVMGSIWGSEMWGTYWSWGDVRLVTLFVTWLVYLGYLLVFAATRDSEDRFAAAYGVLGFVTIPVSYVSTRLWNPAFHDPTVGAESSGTVIEPVALVLAIVAVSLLFVSLAAVRYRLHRVRDTVIRATGGR